ncbi:MAG: cupin domain-containing protein [Polyangia bacterium]
MTAPTHHLDEDVLLDYVSGAASEPVSLVVACHLTLCGACRAAAAAAEFVGGVVLEQARPAALSEGALERALARLDRDSLAGSPDGERRSATEEGDDDGPGPVAAAGEPFVFEGVPLPRPLARYLAAGPSSSSSSSVAPPGSAPSFRFIAPGVRGIPLAVAAAPGVRTRLLRLAPGMEIPLHAHAAPEFTLVFSGGLSDGGQHYVRGDVRFRDAAAVHNQRVDPDLPCVALVVNEGALVPQTWRGRLVSLLFDR